jgi:hypothetical protein
MILAIGLARLTSPTRPMILPLLPRARRRTSAPPAGEGPHGRARARRSPEEQDEGTVGGGGHAPGDSVQVVQVPPEEPDRPRDTARCSCGDAPLGRCACPQENSRLSAALRPGRERILARVQVGLVFRSQLRGVAHDPEVERSLTGQPQALGFREYVDAGPCDWLVSPGRGPRGPTRYARTDIASGGGTSGAGPVA